MVKVLVTGGAGYIGSHTIKALAEKNYHVITLDNLSTGFAEAVLYGELWDVDLLNRDALKKAIKEAKPDVVMHFASLIVVPESVKNPLKYYRNNVVGSINLLEAMKEYGVDKLIFSSSAAVYGIPGKIPVSEDSPLLPINPYGKTKKVVEEMLADFYHLTFLDYVSLRYFNVAGADPQGSLGERKKEANHLITVATRTACGKLSELEIYGTDYDTPDGTCIRDFIHVSDLAQAHVAALEYLLDGGQSTAFNCGYGRGYSVLEVIDAVKRVTGVDFKVVEGKRRPGDPPALVAEAKKLEGKLDWQPKYDDLDYIIKTAWEWEQKLGKMPPRIRKISSS